MEPEKYPFYPFSQEDRLIKKANKDGLVTVEARVTKELKTRCSQYSFKLEPECRLAILAIVCETFDVKDRLPLHIQISMQEISMKIRSVAKEKFNVELKVLFIGGGVVKALKPLFLDFFEKCGLNDLITPVFNAKLNIKPNDYDFEYIADLDKAENYRTLVDEGVVDPLANKINWEQTNRTFLASQLNNSKKYSEKLPKDSYLKRVFDGHSPFNKDSKDLRQFAVKAFGFTKANESDGQFYFRNIASHENSYDCFFPIGNLNTINSFCIDISKIDQEDADLYLESLLGKEMLVQAIIDANFALLYSDQDQPANELDFARTMCHLSKKGRLVGPEWLSKTYLAFDQEREKRGSKLSEMLIGQLISRADNHHRSPQQGLIVMTFNASAILMTMNPELEEEIQKLWQEVAKYLIKNGKNQPYDPLIEMIKVLMCDSGNSFREVISQIQVSAMLKQHESKEGGGTYKCRPSQTENRLFTQIVIRFSKEDLSLDYGTLFFPYDLLGAIPHISNLKPLHDLLVEGSNLAVGINKSVLKKDRYRSDPRRNILESQKKGIGLLESKNEHVWRMGFLLTLSHLAMYEDELLLRDLLEKLIPMLLQKWPSIDFKNEMALLMCEMLQKSHIYVRDAFFQNPTPNSIIGDLLSSDKKLLGDLGRSLFKKVEGNNHDVLEKLYLDLFSSTYELPLLKYLLEHMASSTQLSVDSALKGYKIVFDRLELVRGIEADLLEAVLTSIQRFKTSRDALPAFMEIVLQSKACKVHAHLGLSLSWEAHRLKIFNQEAVSGIHKSAIRAKEIHPVYLTEKFDALSDFMQYYALQSLPAIKASISRRIQSDVKDGLLQLICILAKSKAAWNERVFILEALENLPPDEIEKVIELFLHSSSTLSNSEQVHFFLENKESLHPLLSLMCDETTDNEVGLCAERILQVNKEKGLSRSHRKRISEKFVGQLYDRKLWKELKSIYVASPPILIEWTPISVSFFIQSYHHFVNPEQLLKTIPLDLELSDEMKEILGALLLKGQNKALADGEFVEALQWAKQWKSIGDPDVFLKHWGETTPELLFQCQQYKQGLHELIYQVLCWTDPDPILWDKYIAVAIPHAPMEVLENLLLLQPNVELVNRLEEYGSLQFLQPLTWWPEMWKKLENESVKRSIVYSLIRGAANASLQTKQGIKDVLKILESEEVASYIDPKNAEFTCLLRLNFARLSWFSDIAEQKTKALSTLLATFILMGDDLLIEEKAVSLFNTFLKNRPSHMSMGDIRLFFSLIESVNECSSVENANHVAILRFLKDAIEEKKEKLIDVLGGVLNCVNESVKMVVNRSIQDSQVKTKEINLVRWGIIQLYNSDLLMGFDLAVWCLNNPYISLYLDKNGIEKLVEHKNSLNHCGPIVKVIHVWEHTIKCKNDLLAPFQRYLYLRDQGLQGQFQLQNAEGKALERSIRKITKTIIQFNYVVIVIMSVAVSVLKLYNSRK